MYERQRIQRSKARAETRVPAPGGEALSPRVRASLEPRFGHSFANVRIHSDGEADEAARRLDARAFAFGNHITFRRGEYDPDTPAGHWLLAHELTHVVQQSRSPAPAHGERAVSHPDDAAEREAGALADATLAGSRVSVSARPSAAVSRFPAATALMPPFLPPFWPLLSGTPYEETQKQQEQQKQQAERTQPAGYTNEDPALDPVRNALNDPKLSHEQRAQMMLDYRNAQAERMSVNGDTAWAMKEMAQGSPDAPVHLDGPTKGSHMPLYQKLGEDPDMQVLMGKLATSISSQDPAKLDIQKIFAEVQQNALDIDARDPHRDRNLMALQAMATLVNVGKFDPQNKGNQPPPEILEKLPPGLYEQIKAAGGALAGSTSPNAAVMGRGQTDANAFDNNAHFFTHAYLTGSLVKEYGLSPKDAQAMSGMIGAQYELLPTSLYEGSGNAGLKDILMNAEGASFGSDLVSGKRPALPGQMEGPPPENRDRTAFPDANPAELPGPVKDISEKSMSKWGLLWHLL